MQPHPSPDPNSPICRRIREAEQDLLEADGLDLATADPAQLVITVEKLRGSLADVLRILRHRGPAGQ